MRKSVFKISKMDCPAEENLIRMKLAEFTEVKSLSFDLTNRRVTIFHEDKTEAITSAINSLNLGSEMLGSDLTQERPNTQQSQQKKTLWAVLLINFSFFLIELTTGLISKSMGLIADSLDMLADSLVYGISLFAVGSSLHRKKKVASLAGYFQLVLALIGFSEVVRRFLASEKIPDVDTMIIVSVFALAANAVCLYLLNQSKSKAEAHMQASMIFTSNDIIINLGVIVAGCLVYWVDSNKPDLIIGSIVFLIVIRGAFRIIKIGR